VCFRVRTKVVPCVSVAVPCLASGFLAEKNFVSVEMTALRLLSNSMFLLAFSTVYVPLSLLLPSGHSLTSHRSRTH
jgi:hypothetical protein